MEPLPSGRLSLSHYQAVHRHIFQDVYPWAGRFRAVRISKGTSTFCYPENIVPELKRVFKELKDQVCLRGLDPAQFAVEAAHFLTELNAIHPFRDGNGRSQLAFLALLSVQAGHPLHLERLHPSSFLAAMIASFYGREDALGRQLASLI